MAATLDKPTFLFLDGFHLSIVDPRFLYCALHVVRYLIGILRRLNCKGYYHTPVSEIKWLDCSKYSLIAWHWRHLSFFIFLHTWGEVNKCLLFDIRVGVLRIGLMISVGQSSIPFVITCDRHLRKACLKIKYKQLWLMKHCLTNYSFRY